MEIRGGDVLIKAERTATCESCMSKDACRSLTETDMVVEAENTVGAKAGDRVIFSVGSATLIKAGLLVYLFPLLGFIFGVVLGQALPARYFGELDPDLVSAALGFLFLFFTLWALRRYARRAEKTKALKPRVVKVIGIT